MGLWDYGIMGLWDYGIIFFSDSCYGFQPKTYGVISDQYLSDEVKAYIPKISTRS